MDTRRILHLGTIILVLSVIGIVLDRSVSGTLRHSQGAAAILASTGGCLINTASDTAATRLVHFTMSGCSGVERFQISEDPNFKHPSGVQISLSNFAADGSSADVSISYKNASSSASITPYALPAKRTLNALAVVYTFVDKDGNDHGMGTYETPTWLNRFIFGDNVIGFDGYYKKDSFKDHILQSTIGRVTLTGETYPRVVKLDIEKYRRFLDAPVPGILADIIATIKRDDPTFFDNKKFDYFFPVSSAYYSIDRGYNNKGNHTLHQIPYDASTSIFSNTIQEVRISHDTQRVVTRYNPRAVEGVWLASDTDRTGTNYYTGGSAPWFGVGADYKYIQLGTPLPSPNEAVIVRYTADVAESVASSQLDTVGSKGWGGVYMHENYHDLGGQWQMRFSTNTGIGDPYINPTLMPGYDVMQNNSLAVTHPTFGSMDGTPLFSAPQKIELGYLTPLTLAYGGSVSKAKLARAEFSDVTQVENNVTMIKVPLRPFGDPGIYTLQKGGYYTENGTQDVYREQASPQFVGEEYLLLELRSKKPLPGGNFNFDQAVRSEGVVVYHMVQKNIFGSTLHVGSEIAKNIDATPPYLGGYSNVAGSGAAFGPETNTYTLTLDELWQEKPLSSDTHAFDFLLSEGRGTKTLYARFVGPTGAVLGTETLSITLDSDATAASSAPTLTLSPITGGATQQRITGSFTAPNGASRLKFYLDDREKGDKTYYAGETTGSEDIVFYDDQLMPGDHTIRYILVDKAGIVLEKTAHYTARGATYPPTLTMQASPSSIQVGQQTIIAWTTTGVAYCTSPEGWYNPSTIGNISYQSPAETTTYTLTCTGAAGSVTESVTVTVNGTTTPPPSPVPTLSFSATPTSVADGASVVLTWSSLYASSCSANGGWTGAKTLSGSETRSPGANTSYSLVCVGTGGSITKSVAVTVTTASTTPTVPPITPTPTSTPPSDTTPPAVTITSPVNGARIKGNGSVSINVTASDASGIAVIAISTDGTLRKTCQNVSSCAYSWQGKSISSGSHSITVVARDTNGNQNTASATIIK